MSDPSGQFLLYTAPNGAVRVDVFFKEETLLAIRRISEMSAEAVEDTAVEPSTANERQRMARANEDGPIAVVRTNEVEQSDVDIEPWLAKKDSAHLHLVASWI